MNDNVSKPPLTDDEKAHIALFKNIPIGAAFQADFKGVTKQFKIVEAKPDNTWICMPVSGSKDLNRLGGYSDRELSNVVYPIP